MTLKATWSNSENDITKEARREQILSYQSKRGEECAVCQRTVMGTCQRLRAALTGVRTRLGARSQYCYDGRLLVWCMLGGGDARSEQGKNERNLILKLHLPKFLFRSPPFFPQHVFLFHFKKSKEFKQL